MSDTRKSRGPVLVDRGGPVRPPVPPRAAPAADAGEGESRAVQDRMASPGSLASPPPSPADAPAIDDPGLPDTAAAGDMALLARILGRRTPLVLRLLLGAGGGLAGFVVSVGVARLIAGLFATYPLLGWIGAALLALFVAAALVLVLREWLAFRRLRRIDHIQRMAAAALTRTDSTGAAETLAALAALYRHRPELADALRRLDELVPDADSGASLLAGAEAILMVPLDQAARREIEAAARLVAAATALVPLALVDVVSALFANLRMIRRLAELYGGRAGAFGSWRLARNVMAHLVATGAVAASDDLVHTVVGGGALAKLSRRFGEGVINGALTARVGIAAMEVCRPLPFLAQPRPRVTNLVSRALRGLFGGDR